MFVLDVRGEEYELDGFYYRDDGVKVWNAFIRHVSTVLTAAFGPDGDAAVAAYADLALWVEEMRSPDKAAVTSFPASFGSVKALTEALVTIIFMCSAQHAAVNCSGVVCGYRGEAARVEEESG
ncbi:hypothetical protein I4F81_011944 [Pyropia yezoensis]|uniref:Uncharacterized protein n=1 Tax=Pyropia yezoensis TaxID=2788 RepID=A0ACC3CHA0_PYRYE|nr:hypothetical protein I4F81_011944 [Neopyropia yezoensis]